MSKVDSPVDVLLVASHPVQYAAPIYRQYALDPRVDITVAYCSMQGAELGRDHEFGRDLLWDIPLLDGYRWKSLRNISLRPKLSGFFGLVNPGLWSLIRKGDFEVVVCFGYSALSFWIAALAAKRFDRSLVWTNDAPTLDRPHVGRLRRRVKRLVVRIIYRIADGALAPTTSSAKLFRELGIPEDRVFLSPFAMDVDRFDAGRAVDWRATLGLSEEDFVVLFVGKLIARKRAADAILACSRVEGCHLVLAGDGDQRDQLERLAADVAPNRVHFPGLVNQSDLPNLYASSDALVVCSDYDPGPIVVMEAMSSGRPVVASSAIGAIGDVVRDGETGLVYRCGDVDQMTVKLEWLRVNEESRLAMGARARARMKQWGPDQNREAFVKACRALTGRDQLS